MLFLLYIPAIVLLGLITSHEDMKKGIIRNKLVLFAIIYSFFVLIIIRPDIEYISSFFMNSFFATIAAILFWLVNLWSAGDAKLFIAYVFLIPLNSYVYGYDNLFPAMAVLVNTFLPLFVFYFLKTFSKITWQQLIKTLKFSFDKKKLSNLFISFFAISWPLYFLSSMNNIFSNLFLAVIVIFLILSLLEFLLPGKQIKWFIVISLIRLLIDRSILKQEFWVMFSIFFISYLILRYFVLFLSFSAFTKDINIEELKPGMMLAQKVVKKGKGFVLQDAFITNLFEGLKKQKNSILAPKVLNKGDITFIKKSHSDNKIKKHQIKVQEFVSFALFLFMGVILTLFFRGNIVVFILETFL
jgi:archaeal preflagellin peptidase FlaK